MDLWLVGKIPPKTWENCRETSERKARTHSYDDLIDLLIELAMDKENDSHMDKYLRKHLRSQNPAERNPGGRSSEPHSNPGKSRGGQLKHMQETPPSNGKGVPNLFYCHPTDDKGGPCHTHDCDGQSTCLLQLQRKQKTKDGQEIKHQDYFGCTHVRVLRQASALRGRMPHKTPWIGKAQESGRREKEASW